MIEHCFDQLPREAGSTRGAVNIHPPQQPLVRAFRSRLDHEASGSKQCLFAKSAEYDVAAQPAGEKSQWLCEFIFIRGAERLRMQTQCLQPDVAVKSGLVGPKRANQKVHV